MSLLVSIKPGTGVVGHIVVAPEICIVNITSENDNGIEKIYIYFPSFLIRERMTGVFKKGKFLNVLPLVFRNKELG